jgi:hypothetical protein
MNWVWFIGGTWIAVGIALALLIGRSIHLANLRAADTGPEDVPSSTVVPPPTAGAPAIARHTALIRRRHSPLNFSAHAPLIGGCVSPTKRASSAHQHGRSDRGH